MFFLFPISELWGEHACGREQSRFFSRKKSFPLRIWNRYLGLLPRQMPITIGQKNERGARGSTEEEISASKHPDIVTDNVLSEIVEEAEKVVTANEPNLNNIQTLLISIQRTTENILKENKLSNEVAELKLSLERFESELLATKTLLSDVKNTNKELRIELDGAKQKNASAKGSNRSTVAWLRQLRAILEKELAQNCWYS